MSTKKTTSSKTMSNKTTSKKTTTKKSSKAPKPTAKSDKATKSEKAAKTTKTPAPKTKAAAKATPKPHDETRPPVGTRLTRMFKGKEIVVTVTADGFKYEGQTFGSISAVARHITGYMISGPVFFKLVEPKRPAAEGK